MPRLVLWTCAVALTVSSVAALTTKSPPQSAPPSVSSQQGEIRN